MLQQMNTKADDYSFRLEYVNSEGHREKIYNAISYNPWTQIMRGNWKFETYDDDGNLTTITDPEGNKTTYEYVDDTSDVAKITLPGGSEFSFTYNDDHQLTKTLSPRDIVTQTVYDDYGNSTDYGASSVFQDSSTQSFYAAQLSQSLSNTSGSGVAAGV